MPLREFIFSPVGFLCSVLLFLLVVIYWIDLFRRIDAAQKAHDLSVKRCHCCGQRINKF